MADYCECGIPWVSGDICDRCNKKISPARLGVVEATPSEGTKVQSSTKPDVRPLQSDGVQAANRVMRYATLWDKIGNVLNILNIIGVIILSIFILISGFEGKYILLGLLLLAILWGLGYLQISIVRGLASYFQMRSADYLERKESE